MRGRHSKAAMAAALEGSRATLPAAARVLQYHVLREKGTERAGTGGERAHDPALSCM